MKIAIVHDWLVTYAGAERVLAALCETWPEADLFAVIDFLCDEDRARLGGKRATTTFIQQLPKARSAYQKYLPLMPLAIEQLDMSAYDLVISSSHAVAKGVLTGPNQLHISYVHSPIRYAWDLQHQYLHEASLDRGVKAKLARMLLHYMRMWDQRTASGVDEFIANSHFIAKRINKSYRRQSTVIYPPVDTSRFTLHEAKEDFYLTASRMVPYKKIPLIVEAFAAMPDKRLVVIGTGPEMERVREVASANVTLMGYQSDEVLRQYMQRARAFVFAAEEDFGIAPIEAQACGTPVIAFARGGVLETIRGLEHEKPTGVFYPEQSVDSIVAAVRTFETHCQRISASNCRSNAERFGGERFKQEIKAFVEARIREVSLLDGQLALQGRAAIQPLLSAKHA
ncbi:MULTISPECIES: glycosyltransferase family 4 protein [Pseudomonadaceae]|jgi:glycosyltransferase involved in cell wall biosynthesis|uniref:Glycosyltransferase family 4 protein n=1 Tax=Stutzerimonas degradans TaxID=2968968 RepID=A0A4P9DWM5_9GAMM|nr:MULTISPECIES: glycosyltransferase family 4 protein [Pseudomonadaceae]MDT3709693.1 glycosyltransferase family 4 protein [Pseudomonadaceae bacterium]KGK81518.1 glycosyl transferase [Stutzerimonas degradans]MCQ4232958.1 glycosyltransferase family 4 protein [Stutzerimonas degradans]MCQ4266010.1 glycosyltransferase family 4 protein [Stutzerimonas degradans]MCQ4276292.1 glycosyltransferase family 4 protein [Stutzerimonas degradans]